MFLALPLAQGILAEMLKKTDATMKSIREQEAAHFQCTLGHIQSNGDMIDLALTTVEVVTKVPLTFGMAHTLLFSSFSNCNNKAFRSCLASRTSDNAGRISMYLIK